MSAIRWFRSGLSSIRSWFSASPRFLALLLVVSDVIAHRRARVATPPPVSTARANYTLVVIAFAIFAIYVIALPYLGFRVATFAFLVAMPLALSRRAALAGAG